MSNVKIALRVRPLSERELCDGTPVTSVVTVEDEKTASVTNLKVSLFHAGDSRERVKRFIFDYCFDSSLPDKENHATQEIVFSKLSKVILESFARGQDVCVLAYGQSASGKTYTMQGTEYNPGLAPRICDAIFETSGEENSKLSISYFEIYNEKVRDLLTNVQLESFEADKEISNNGYLANQTKGLRVREHPSNGPYVEGLKDICITKKEYLSTLLKIGSSRRRTAATQRNHESSRSHAVLTLKKGNPGTSLTLLDLAGSERPSSVNQSVSHQKEGSNINKSLVALSNVISALAEVNPRAHRYVPYRDSVLTWLLKDTLSGGTTTVMVATVSPSSSCYTETVNTMRWAARAGRIQAATSTNTKTPKSATQRSLKALRAEVARLKELLLNVAKEKIARDPIEVSNQTTQVSFHAKLENEHKDIKYHRDNGHENDVSECTIKEENSQNDDNREQEGEDSLNSLASSRLSIASNDTLSTPSTHGSGLHSGPAEDILFGPRLNRTNSVHEIKPLPPLRNKNRQYSSHEGLANAERRPSKTPIVRLNKNVMNRLGDREKIESFNADSRPHEAVNENSKQTHHVPYEPFNKRAVMVASVTDRLYSNTKKAEDLNKMGSFSRNDSKVSSGPRKRLYDISYRALRASRRFRIGVPAETQTDKVSSIRVKEVGTDIQNDIDPIPFINDETNKKLCSVGVVTESHTLLCKEVSVGTINGSMSSEDKNVETEKHDSYGNIVFKKSCGNVTDKTCTFSISTQTEEIPPPRKKYSSFTKYLKVKQDSSTPESGGDRLSPKVFNISISHDCNQFENEGDSISDDSLECDIKVPDINLKSHATPDLLNNHSSSENITSRSEDPSNAVVKSHNENSSQTSHEDYNNKRQSDLNNIFNVYVGDLNTGVNDVKYKDNSKATNSNIIKSKMGVNINDRCDRVTNTRGEVIKEHDVTRSSLQSAVILNADTIKLNNNSGGDDKMNSENYHLCTSKSTQVDNSIEPHILAEFLEDIYVPLPRICVTTDFNTDRWPSMRNIILGRNENAYPYNIKLSPKKEDTGTRKRSKSVSWKMDKNDAEIRPKVSQRRSFSYKLPISSNDDPYIRPSSNTEQINTLEKDRHLEDYTYQGHKKYFIPKSNFRGIRAWEDRIPYSPKPYLRVKSPVKDNVYECETRYDATCVHYVNATSNLINETTNLVASFGNDGVNKCEEKVETLENNVSPVCNQTLQTIDENKNGSDTSTMSQLSAPSTSRDFNENIDKNPSPDIEPHIINDELIWNEDDSDNSDLYDEVAFSSDEDLMALSQNIDEVENDLYASIDRLEERTAKSSEYFKELPKRYFEKYERNLSYVPDSGEGPIPFPRHRKNPSKYLEELLKIRKDLVECTKRDDFICKQFKK